MASGMLVPALGLDESRDALHACASPPPPRGLREGTPLLRDVPHLVATANLEIGPPGRSVNGLGCFRVEGAQGQQGASASRYLLSLYLNQKYVFDVLSMMERGISQLESITSRREGQEETERGASGEVGFGNARREIIAQGETGRFQRVLSGAYRDRTGDLRLAKPRGPDDDRRRVTTTGDETRMGAETKADHPWNQADAENERRPAMWRRGGVRRRPIVLALGA